MPRGGHYEGPKPMKYYVEPTGAFGLGQAQ